MFKLFETITMYVRVLKLETMNVMVTNPAVYGKADVKEPYCIHNTFTVNNTQVT